MFIVIFHDSIPVRPSHNLPDRSSPNFDRTVMDADYQSEISFSIPQGTWSWQTIFVGCIHRTDSLDAGGYWRSRAG